MNLASFTLILTPSLEVVLWWGKGKGIAWQSCSSSIRKEYEEMAWFVCLLFCVFFLLRSVAGLEPASLVTEMGTNRSKPATLSSSDMTMSAVHLWYKCNSRIEDYSNSWSSAHVCKFIHLKHPSKVYIFPQELLVCSVFLLHEKQSAQRKG